MRGIGFKIAPVVGAIAPGRAALRLVGSSSEPDATVLIAPLLPKGEGLWAANITGQPVEGEENVEPTEHRAPDSQPCMRQVPRVLRDRAMHALTLELFGDRKANCDWIYNFRLAAGVESLGTPLAAGAGARYAHDKTFRPARAGAAVGRRALAMGKPLSARPRRRSPAPAA
jgi:hypothetical protein